MKTLFQYYFFGAKIFKIRPQIEKLCNFENISKIKKKSKVSKEKCASRLARMAVYVQKLQNFPKKFKFILVFLKI